MSAPGASRTFPLALAAALLALGAALAAKLVSSSSEPHNTPPTVADPERPVEAWTSADGLWRLTPLHAEAERQQFEAQALRKALALPEGEPFRLVRHGAAGGGQQVEITDEHGLALTPIEAESGSTDPVRALVATPLGFERAGEREWILWGRAPHDGARVVQDARATESAVAVELQRSKVRRADLEQPLAQLVAPATNGKKPERAASEAGRDAAVPSNR